MKRVTRVVLLVLLIAVFVIFISQNMQVVRLTFIKWYIEMPLSITSIVIYILGALSGSLLFSVLKKLYDGSFKNRE